LKEKARLECEEIENEQRTKREKELSQLKETMRLEKEEREEQWERKQKQYEFEINQLEERAKLESTEMEKLRKDNEQLMGLREEERLRWEGKWSQKETETNRHAETTEIKCTETREIEGELDGVKDGHTHTEVARLNGGELADCLVTRCEQPDSLLMERRETLCSLEADRDQVGPVELCELEGASAVDGCTRSLGGMEAPGALVVTRFPSVIVPVCVVKGVSAAGVLKLAPCVTETPCVEETPSMKETPCVSGVVASVPGCVLPSTPCMSEQPGVNEAPRVREAACARETARVSEQPCVSERPSVRETACVRSLYVREMAVGMREGTTACPSAMVECVSVRARENVRVRVRQRRCLTRDKGRVAAVAISSTVPGLHSSERGVRAVLRTRPPRARLRE